MPPQLPGHGTYSYSKMKVEARLARSGLAASPQSIKAAQTQRLSDREAVANGTGDLSSIIDRIMRRDPVVATQYFKYGAHTVTQCGTAWSCDCRCTDAVCEHIVHKLF